ncbi:stealth family protein [Propionicimonas sp.]|uniref:stealth family protein n=1 Tax=Propionicimonas sp. TaxID=1955623 RepID=UPI0039E227D3
MSRPSAPREWARRAARSAYVGSLRLRRRSGPWVWQRLPAWLRRPYETVETFDAHAYLAGLVSDLSAVLHRNGVEHLILDQRLLGLPRVAIRRDDAPAVMRALAGDPSTRRWWAARSEAGVVGLPAPVAWRTTSTFGVSGILLSRNLLSPSGAPLTDAETGVLLEFWIREDTETLATGGGLHQPGTVHGPTHNGILDYAGPALWAEIQANAHRLPARPPHLLQLSEPVDLVYTWVDGDDPAWLRRKAAALGDRDLSGVSVDAEIAARFENRDELRYSLRSVEMFANWAHRIWVVTDQQVPAWLRQDERLRIVDHREIFADPSALPVYNSHAIESQLHHIPGLAEHYLYLNDDMLFGARAQPEDFFHGNGISKFFTSPALLDIGGHDPGDLAVAAAAKNNRDLIEAEFGRTIVHKLRHTPQPQVRSVIEGFEADHPELFDAVMRSRLRHASNYSLTSSLSQYYAFAVRRAVPGRIDYGYVDLAAERPEVTLERWLRRRRRLTFCINDSGDDDAASRARKDAALREFFEVYFPLPSRWEIPT